MVKFFNDKLLAGFLIVLFGSIITFGYQYFQDSSNKPRLILDAMYEYSQIGNISVGNIVVVNNGKKTDEDISIQVNEKVDKYDVKISGASIEPEVKKFNDYTEFVIPKLNPDERIHLSFTPTSDSTSFDATINSKSGNYEYLTWPPEWWEINTVQRNALIVLIILSMLLGIILGRIKLFQKKARRK